MKRLTPVQRLATVPAVCWGEISIFFSASSKLKHLTVRHEHAICLQNIGQEDGIEDHSASRSSCCTSIPTDSLNFHQGAGIPLFVCTWKSVKMALCCRGCSDLTQEVTCTPSYIYSLVFRGVCPAPQSSDVDSPWRRTSPQGNVILELGNVSQLFCLEHKSIITMLPGRNMWM